MKELNLVVNTSSQQKVKDYLQQNASDVLVDKINNGVKTEKDDKILINKKTLDGFMKYATEEARKQAEKGASYACIEDSIVFGWAIHYFEEDSIEGTLYNEDGTEYIKPKAKQTKSKKSTTSKSTTKPVITSAKKEIEVPPTIEATPAKPQKSQPEQITLFDLMG